MGPRPLVEQVRDFYVEQFRIFVSEQKKISPGGIAELKLKLNDQGEIFSQLYCLDFYRNDEGINGGVELSPKFYSFETIDGVYGRAKLSIVHLRWEDVIIRHDVAEAPPELLRWFRWWFDPDDERTDAEADVTGCIHSILVEPGAINIDFGTAEPDAFWSILELLEAAGATNIQIGSSRADAEGVA